jgi:predicted DNA-binding transcriptional regulator AlpA
MSDKDPNRRIQAARVRELCGNVSTMWLWRRQNDPASDFPRPVLIGRRRFWREAEIIEWLDAQAEKEAA